MTAMPNMTKSNLRRLPSDFTTNAVNIATIIAAKATTVTAPMTGIWMIELQAANAGPNNDIAATVEITRCVLKSIIIGLTSECGW